MATTFTTTVTAKKPQKVAPQSATVGQLFTKDFTFTIPVSAANVDYAALTGITVPANTAVIAAYTKSNANGPANSAISMKGTTTGNVFFNAANNVTDTWLSQSITAANAVFRNEETITVTQTGSANATGAVTIECTLVLAGLGATDPTFTTYTI